MNLQTASNTQSAPKSIPHPNFKKLSDDELRETLHSSAKSENEYKILVLHLMAEFDRRRLYAKENKSSLFEYCTTVLKFSAGSTQRRIDTMRAMKLIPEIEQKLVTGELNLSSVSQAQKLFRHEAKVGKSYNIDERKVVLQMLENKSSRECERQIAAISPSSVVKEKRRILSCDDNGETKTEMKVVVDGQLVKKLDKIKALLSHKNPRMTDRELLEEMADVVLAKLDPQQKALRAVKRVTKKNENSHPTSDVDPRRKQSKSRYIPAHVKHQVWIRDQGQCSHPGCSSDWFLEYGHIHSYSLGGEATVDNIRLLCRAHNQREAIDQFGLQKMALHIEKG